MALSQVDMCGKESGPIWTRKPTPDIRNGLLLEITNIKSGLTTLGKHMQFTRVAFGLHGNWFAAGDRLGNVYHFDLDKNRFKLVLRLGQACTAMVCCLTRPNEVLVALTDYSIKCVDVERPEVVASLREHEAPVHSISLHSSGQLALAVSSRDCMLWDLNTFTRCRTLNGGQDVGIQDVFFIPLTSLLLSCFKDDSIHAWETGSLEYKYKLASPFGPTPHYRAFAVPQDGRLLVGGGRSSFLHVWAMESRQLLRVIQLPAKVRIVKQLLFLPDNFDGGSSECLGFLAQDGIMRFINIHSCKLLFQIGSHEKMLASVRVSPSGKHIVSISDAGNLLIFDVATLAQDLYQAPAPLVRMMEGDEEEEEKERKISSKKSTKISKMVGSRSPAQRRTGSSAKSRNVTSLIPHDKPVSPVREEGEAGEKVIMDRDKLFAVLKGYGEYPAKYRMFIWRYLLDLPENHTAYSSLLDKGTHPSFTTLHQHYPIKSRKLLRVLQRALSALAHWSSIFGETDYLPGLVFPFVKLFQNNQLVTFEMLATILINWCGQWFEYFPNPPLNILAMVENCLAHHDPYLLEHLIQFNISTQQYVWPLLETLFSEVLSKGDWLKVWDNILSHHPGYLLLVVVAYLTSARNTLMKCTQVEDFEFFIHHQSSVEIGGVIREANLLQQTTPLDIHPEKLLDAFAPLSKGTYPVFNKYPKFIVDYQLQERERIRTEELEYLRERQSALEMERMTEQRKQEEEAWYRQQKLLMEAEGQRRKMMEGEDNKLTDQRARLQALKRELKVKELHVLDAARRRFLGHQQTVRESELKRMDQQIQKKVVQRETETHNVLEDIETRTLELERQKALLEHELGRCQEEMLYKLRVDASADQHGAELEKSMLERAIEEQAQREREGHDKAHAMLAKTQVEKANSATVLEAKARRSVRELKQGVKMEELAQKSQLNNIHERNIQVLLEGLEKEARGSSTTRDSDSTSTYLSSIDDDGGNDPVHHHHSATFSSGTETRDSLTLTTLDSSESGVVPPPTVGVAESALQWAHRRDDLDQQESAMLSRVRDLRKKVAGQMKNSTLSSQTVDTTLTTPTPPPRRRH